jgi:superfamily II DNA helicase RecQ
MYAARAALQETFGYGEFRPGQEDVIRHLLAGRSRRSCCRA